MQELARRLLVLLAADPIDYLSGSGRALPLSKLKPELRCMIDGPLRIRHKRIFYTNAEGKKVIVQEGSVIATKVAGMRVRDFKPHFAEMKKLVERAEKMEAKKAPKEDKSDDGPDLQALAKMLLESGMLERAVKQME